MIGNVRWCRAVDEIGTHTASQSDAQAAAIKAGNTKTFSRQYESLPKDQHCDGNMTNRLPMSRSCAQTTLKVGTLTNMDLIMLFVNPISKLAGSYLALCVTACGGGGVSPNRSAHIHRFNISYNANNADNADDTNNADTPTTPTTLRPYGSYDPDSAIAINGILPQAQKSFSQNRDASRQRSVLQILRQLRHHDAEMIS